MTEHSRHAQAHIDSIVKQEEEALERRSSSERLADSVGTFAGSLPFVVLHLVLVTAWLLPQLRLLLETTRESILTGWGQLLARPRRLSRI